MGRKGQGRAAPRRVETEPAAGDSPVVGEPIPGARPASETVPETISFTTQDFKVTMGRFASGVTVLTTRLGALRAGLTVNAFCSLSLDPPLVLVCVDRASRVHDVLVQAGIFAVNLLTADQEDISRCFSGQSASRWEHLCGCATHSVATGAPVFDVSLGFVDCRITDIFPGGDHSIVVGRVEALGAQVGEPLLYYRSRYAALKVPSKRTSRRSAAAMRSPASTNGRAAGAAHPAPRPRRSKTTRATGERATNGAAGGALGGSTA